MIVPMKKSTIFVRPHRTEDATRALADLGLLHPEITVTTNSSLDKIKTEMSRVEQALLLVPSVDEILTPPSVNQGEVNFVLEKVLQSGDELQKLKDESEFLQQEIARVGSWGNFEPELLSTIQGHGVFAYLLQLTKSQYDGLKNSIRFIPVSIQKNEIRGIAICDSSEDLGKEGVEAFVPPSKSIKSMETRIQEIQNQVQQIHDHLSGLTEERGILDSYYGTLQESFQYQLVQDSMADHEVASVISGYLPASDEDKLKSLARTKGWGLLVKDPEEEDQVPTLTKNPRAIRIIQPVFDLLATVPGYREKDISLWFLIFFTMFFAMIIGDAAYGVILLTLSIFLGFKQKKAKGRVHDGVLLLGVLSLSTVVWGAITGNWFGYEPIGKLPGFRNLIVPGLDSFTPQSAVAVQFMCFVIGTTHIVLAHTLQIIEKLKQRLAFKALAQLGWLVTVLGLYYLVLNVVIDPVRFPIPDYALGMIIGGIVAVFLFENQEGDGFFKGIVRSLGGLIPTALSGVSSFSDIISYIRLFAVGLSGIEIAKSFNGMAGDMFESGIGGIIAGVLVVAFGHTLNLAMAGLSVVVHGVRLNMLEFSSHAGIEWAGFSYEPFRSKSVTQ